MGLFWSLQAAPGQKRGLRLLKRNVLQPLVVELSVLPGHWTADLHTVNHQQRLACQAINRLYAARDVVAFDVRAGSVRGRLYLPPGKFVNRPMTSQLRNCCANVSIIESTIECL